MVRHGGRYAERLVGGVQVMADVYGSCIVHSGSREPGNEPDGVGDQEQPASAPTYSPSASTVDTVHEAGRLSRK